MRFALLGAALLWIVGPEAARAEDGNPLDTTVLLDLGGFFLSTDIRVRVDGQMTGQVGDTIDFDDTFGVGEFDRFRLDGLWRISGKHSVRGTYFTNQRSATRELSRDINFGDETFPVNSFTTARSDLKVMQISYDYAFRRRENYELAAGIGLHVLDAGLSLDTTISTGGGSASRELSESASSGAPLPVLGIRGMWRLPHNFYATALAQFFYVDFDEYTGSLSDLKATIVWQASPHVGIGLGYNDFRFRFKLDKRAFDGRMRWDYGGAMAFVSLTY